MYITANIIHCIVITLLTLISGGGLLDCIKAILPDFDTIHLFILYQQTLLIGQLWTLISTVLAYCVLWIYTRFQGDTDTDYRLLYFAGFVLFCIYFLLAVLLPRLGVVVPFYAYRNGWFLGIPCFLLGMFLCQYRDHIFRIFPLSSPLLLGVFTLSSLYSVLHWCLQRMGMPVSMPVQFLSLMLLVIRNPQPFPQGRPLPQKLASRLGSLSTDVYVLHVTVMTAYNFLVYARATMFFGTWEPWLRPWFVLLGTLLAALLWAFVRSAQAATPRENHNSNR